jgi:lysophospholipase L1-like esterase
MRHISSGPWWNGFVLLFILAWQGCTAPPPKTRIPARQFEGLTRVACIGDSITAGSGLPNPAASSYPAVLGMIMGPAYEVRNFGVSGATLLRDGDKPYVQTPEFAAARAFLPDVVIILLGTNDSKPQNWRFGDSFERDSYSMIRAFKALPGEPIVYVCTPPPVFGDQWGITGAIVEQQIAPSLRTICGREFWPLIDLNLALRSSQAQFPDGVHPNAVGAASIASTVEKALRGR